MASAMEEGPEAVEEMLACLLEVLAALRIEPDLPGRVAAVGMAARAGPPFWVALEPPPILPAMP